MERESLSPSSPSLPLLPFDCTPLFSSEECDFDMLTRLNSPTLKLIPRRAVGQFARVWGALLIKAVATANHEHWFSALAFPRCVLVATRRGGNRVTRSVTQVILDRIRR